MALAGVLAITSMSLIDPPAKHAEGDVQWMTLEDAMKKAEKEKRPIFVDVYTDWCGWCKVMDKNTFSDPQVATLLNEKFYPVKLNGEQKEDLIFKGNTYKYISRGNGGYHQFAMMLLGDSPSYPTVVFLDDEFNVVQRVPGYRKAPEFHMIAQYFGENQYKKGMTWKDWEKSYQSPY
jgi:thioredoxin-related protein